VVPDTDVDEPSPPLRVDAGGGDEPHLRQVLTGADPKRALHPRALVAEHPVAADGPGHAVLARLVDDSQGRRLAEEKPDLDGVAPRGAVDEGLGAVERIDDPRAGAGRARASAGLLAEDPVLGVGLAEPGPDEAVRGEVGLGDRGPVGLLQGLEAPTPYPLNGSARRAREALGER